MRLVREVLVDHGVAFVNIDDSFQDGRLCLIPERLKIALVGDGWNLRSTITIAKTVPMPERLDGWSWDRCRNKLKSGGASSSKGYPDASGRIARNPNSCEDAELRTKWAECRGCRKCKRNGGYVLRKGAWRPTAASEQILMLAKSDRYFCDGRSVDTPLKDGSKGGANLRDVWTIARSGTSEAHCAPMAAEVVERCITMATSAKGNCPKCGQPIIRQTDLPTEGGVQVPTTVGWLPSCRCKEAKRPVPAVVLDPFAGSGTTLLVAQRLGRNYLGIELYPRYVAMAERRLAEQQTALEKAG
jgi:DNA modification methylase